MKTHHSQGFTLVELLIVVSIAGILLAVGMPGMSTFIKNDRLTSTSNALLGDLMLARSKAVEQNIAVVLCATTNQTSCSNGDFTSGWIVGVDDNENDLIDAGETIIKIKEAIGSDIQITSTLGSSVIFDSRGFTPNTIGTLTIQDGRGGSYAKSLSINRTGRVSR